MPIWYTYGNVNRGQCSCTLLQVWNPARVFVLRGQHSCQCMCITCAAVLAFVLGGLYSTSVWAQLGHTEILKAAETYITAPHNAQSKLHTRKQLYKHPNHFASIVQGAPA